MSGTLLVLLAVACGGDGTAADCEPGESRTCKGDGDCAGRQSCEGMPAGWGACLCGTADAINADAAPPSSDAATPARANAGFDAALPDANADAATTATDAGTWGMDAAVTAEAGTQQSPTPPRIVCAATESDARDDDAGIASAERICAARSCLDASPRCIDDGERVSCCDRKRVPQGVFRMGRCTAGPTVPQCDHFAGDGDELPEFETQVATFYLDTFEVTVGRFRKFVEAYEVGWRPQVGAGAHESLPGGFQAAWFAQLPANAVALRALLTDGDATLRTWTDEPGANEQEPINGVRWVDAYAFCIWDGGRLPTETEWEYAAAGGDQDRLYPWGAEAPDRTRAVYDCQGERPCSASHLYPVASRPAGRARWGHHDLAGSAREWVLTSYVPYPLPFFDPGSEHVLRGGSWMSPGAELRAADRAVDTWLGSDWGFRCARDRADADCPGCDAPACWPEGASCQQKSDCCGSLDGQAACVLDVLFQPGHCRTDCTSSGVCQAGFSCEPLTSDRTACIPDALVGP